MGSTRWRLAVVGAVAVAAVGCGSGEPGPPTPAPTTAAVGPLQPSEPFGLTSATLQSPQGDVALALPVYDAYLPATRARGLMHRSHLPRRTGMVFRFPDEHRGGFYMKNTLIPLSIAFFDANGTVVDVLDMPPCRADPCPTYTPDASYRAALEVNKGFFAEVGLQPGWRVQLPPSLPAAK